MDCPPGRRIGGELMGAKKIRTDFQGDPADPLVLPNLMVG